ncbi:dipeptide/oligopeptide/nickel ABC transporter permease/ATP-binding protein [Paenarthrobacter sp. JL.01a]|uniref:dipeptide/oligopeptide/nickel ABC transporter permease/ATP-binding protein n=1 Tax=Paenarthrobacter sp. JL.01a TaxID=2979324 RepID=UPI0021C8CA90|nr:dipeptide/oligopeptide/nickel ABC transporter permease/ATP-binding protein [Paenarthrobacter sp. JL.01a]UXM93481.1 dipeptide/oligopeptide/nickel ABC transporter permease/ATP-binding protein [Paenarthrobacter sp. JL.01a]
MSTSKKRTRSWVVAALQTPGGMIGGAIVAFYAVMAVVAPPLWGEQASTINASQARLAPTLSHLLGTDELGRDVLLRVLVGTRLTLSLSLGALAIATIGGIVLGTTAAALGARARQLLFQLTATAMAFPAIMLALLLAAVMGRSGVATMVGLGIAGIPSVARLTMSLAVAASGSDYVNASRVIGVRGPRLLRRYILPNVLEPIATMTILSMSSYLLVISSLSFLGLGVQPPDWDWGQLIGAAMKTIYANPTSIIGPGVAIVMAGVSFSLLGEALAEGIDPRSRQRLRNSRKGRPATTAHSHRVESTTPTISRVPEGAVLTIEDLRVTTIHDGDEVDLVKGVTLSVAPGERVGLVGESGSGKSVTLAAAAKLLPPALEATATTHQFDGVDLLDISPKKRRAALGSGLAMVFQDPMSSLNPALRIGSQLGDKLLTHTSLSPVDRKTRIIGALTEVGLPYPELIYRRFPHQLSGGQRQRVMIALALLTETKVILADEPTTALDVSVQAQIIELLARVSRQHNTAIVMVSHDLALVSQLCDRIVVMYGGKIVEEGTTEQILSAPRHPYTRLLLGAVPDPSRDVSLPLLTITDYSWLETLEGGFVSPVGEDHPPAVLLGDPAKTYTSGEESKAWKA